MHHQLIRIGDLIKLTTRELRELDARLRHILDHDTGLTDRDIAVIITSLTNIRATGTPLKPIVHMSVSPVGDHRE